MGVNGLESAVYTLDRDRERFVTGYPLEYESARFLQLEVEIEGSYPTLVFAEEPAESERALSHSQLLERFLSQFDISFVKDFRKSLTSQLMVAPTGKNYSLVGAGYTKWAGDLVEFGELSYDYNQGVNENHLTKIHEIDPIPVPYSAKAPTRQQRQIATMLNS